MILECSVIIILVVILSYFMLRTGKSGYALGTLPLVLVPAFHISSRAIAEFFAKYLPLEFLTLRIAVDLMALVVSCLMIGGIALGIKNRSKRTGFLIMCGSFSIALTCVLIVNMVV